MEYLVAERAGGLMEMPDWSFSNFNIIDANNEQEARDIYNERHNCNFFMVVLLDIFKMEILH